MMWRWYNPVLAFFTPDGVYSFNRDYLTDVHKAVDGGQTVVTYTINPRATYNDGTPIDWRAFENTWRLNRGTDPNYIASSTDGYDQIESVTRGVDDKQAVVRFRGIWAWPDGLFNTLLHPKIATHGTSTAPTSRTRVQNSEPGRTRSRPTTETPGSSSSSATPSGGASGASWTAGCSARWSHRRAQRVPQRRTRRDRRG